MSPLEEKTLTLSGAVFAELMHAVLDRGSPFRFCARGRSMTPFIRDGDSLTIAPLASRLPRVGDIVAFSYPADQRSKLMVHRIVGRRRRGFVVRGDGHGCIAEIVSPEKILGRVVRVERDGRSVRLGLGPERLLIAWLSRTRFLWSLIWPVWRQVHRLFKRQTSSNGFPSITK